MGLKGFWLFSSSVAIVVKGVYIFFSVISNRRYIKVFKLLAHLGIGVYLAVLPKGLYCYNLLLLKGPSCLKATAFHKISVEFLFILSRGFKKRVVDINKRCK